MRDKTMQVDSNNTSNPSKAAIARPKVSVIIPVYNDIVRVEACLTSLENQDYPRDRFEVIVVDNGSSDGTYDALQKVALSYAAQQSLIITQCMIPGSYAARNHGLTMATGEYVAFTDSDCIVCEQWLNVLVNAIQQEVGDVIIAGKMSFFPDQSKSTQQSAIDFENLFSMKQDENARNGKCITANLFCSMALLQEHNGFDQKLKSGGDVEFSTRIVKSGGKIVYCDNALVKHPSRNVQELIIKRKRIIGGTWDAQLASSSLSEKMHFCWRLLKMFLGRSKKVLFGTSLSTSRRIKLIFLLLKIMTVSFSELIKLMWGKEANRA
ncbi:dolichyl-phosphate mannose synthase related protein [Paraglaciecola agarilytica NO2]|uniref:Dolichyl-phosphate mannose synthase related protein n=2 Tax=Paraglaciecola chathamensis TaxID=368405 RepID=A0ABQ0I924_9ALTE|nr:dolichyl-phosphate mannose synthase related protein [Paraglaciecola agarilytica NO2]